METRRETFETLPPEMRFNILRFLDGRSLLNACCVSKIWYGLISPVTFLWERACRSLNLLLREGIQHRMCRALFVRLSQRWRSLAEARSFEVKFFVDNYQDQVTAIYYHDGKLATGSELGIITLWKCPPYTRMWISEYVGVSVTSVKFDDTVFMASYKDGTIRSLDPASGHFMMTYIAGCSPMVSVDYLADADLVVSAGNRILGWDMTSGRLVMVKIFHPEFVRRILIGPYPGTDSSGPTVRKMLVAGRVEESVILWQATSSMNAAGRREVTMQLQKIVRLGCRNHRLQQFRTLPGDELFFDGEYLYFTKNYNGNYNGYVIQFDVANGRIATEILFQNRLKILLGVGEKYMLAVTSDDLEVFNLDIIEKQSCRIFTRSKIIRFRKFKNESEDIFCLGRRSWLDGFDGDNDYGPFAFFVLIPNFVHVLEWNLLNWTR